MIKKIVIILLVISSIISCNKKAEEPEHSTVSDFFKNYEETPERAINGVFKSSKWLQLSEKERDTMFFKLNNIIGQLGSYRGYETIKHINVGESYRIISAIAKYDRQPLRFNFILYKPINEWQIQNFNYDLNIESELEQNITLSFDY